MLNFPRVKPAPPNSTSFNIEAQGEDVLKPFATKLDEKVIEKLDEIAHKTQIPKSRLCRQAIELLAAHYERIEENIHLAERVRQSETLALAESSVH